MTALDEAGLALQKGEYVQAEALIRELEQVPDRVDYRTRTLLGHALEGQQRIDEATEAFQHALELTSDRALQVFLCNKLSDLHYLARGSAAGSVQMAADYLSRSVELEPGPSNAVSRANLCILYAELRRFRELVDQARVLRDWPEFRAEAELQLADAYFYLDEKDPGEACLQALMGIADSLAQGQALRLISLLIKYRWFMQAQQVIDAVAENTGATFELNRYQAQLLFDQKKYPELLAVLSEDFLDSATDPDSARLLYFYRGRALDSIGEYRAAHESFVRMNQLAREAWGKHEPVDFVAAMRQSDLKSIARGAGSRSMPYRLCFMIGFPRSGTSLLDSILDTHPSVKVLSEIDGIAVARQRVAALGRTYPRDLGDLTTAELDDVRVAYLRHNEAHLQGVTGYSLVVDKMPLNVVHLPFIKMLFPEAKFILSIRNPLDVCLSCFQQDFVLNNEMIHFTELASCFQRYRATMEFLQECQEEMELDMLTVRYEELIDKLDQIAPAIFEFLALPPDSGYRDFYLKNRDKLLRTPSRDQITEPLYASSSERWKNYAEVLQPYVPIIRAQLERFGYQAE